MDRQRSGTDALLMLVEEQKRGVARGITAICSANRLVLEACMKLALQDGKGLLVESTSNQVNQDGGYTGMTPAGFASYLQGIASGMEFPMERIIVGGDHLGPNPWQGEAADTAMARARQLVQECVWAGYAKIHLDASMHLGDDLPGRALEPRLAAERTAELCQAGEEASRERPGGAAPVYVIGTEVPPPGGAQDASHALRPTPVEDALETLELTRQAFQKRNLAEAWERVIALVIQPGVEFGDQVVYEYDRQKAAPLRRFIEGIPMIIFEAHSTDYQTPLALKQMVEDHFAILKVGPGLTYAMREAIFALALIEKEWLGGRGNVQVSGLLDVIEQAMLRKPRDWERYYRGEAVEAALARKYSYSDRIRYYWPDPHVNRALAGLLENLERYPPPIGLISQFMPVQYRRLRQGKLANRPLDLIHDRIVEIAEDYAWACDPQDAG